MSETKIEAKAADLEIDRIVEYWEVDPEGEDWESARARLHFAVMKGRIILDEEHERVTMRLVKPIEQENGEQVTHLQFSEPTASDLRVMDKYKKDELMAKTIHLASKMTGLPMGILDRMVSRDLSTMGSVTALFS